MCADASDARPSLTSFMMLTLTLRDFEDARARIDAHIKHTPLLTSRQLSELTGYEVRLKAENFQTVGSYKIRGPLNKFAQMPEEHKKRGVVCSSAGNHAQGAAAAPVAALLHGLVKMPAGSRVVAVISGGNVNLDQLRGLIW